MPVSEAILRSLERTLDQGEEFTSCGIPFPAWLVKKLKGLALLETDCQAGAALYLDGLQDERDAVKDAKFHA